MSTGATGTGTAAFAAFTVAGTGTNTNNGTSSLTFTAFAVAGTGTAGTRGTLVATKLLSNTSTTDGTSVATASHTPVANQVVYAAVGSRATATVVTPTCTGNSLTWVLVGMATCPTSPTTRIAVFRSLGASPTAGATTFDFGVETQTSFVWSIIQFAGADTSGTNGSGATVQSKTAGSSGNVTTLSVTLDSALENAANAMIAFYVTNNNAAHTNDAAFTELSDNAVSSGSANLSVDWAINQTTCAPTWASAAGAVVAIEVKSS